MHKAIIELQERGLISQSTDLETLSQLLDEGKSVYCGFDPTADSLHVGSLLPLTVMNLLKSHGVKVIALVGGATGNIGDPSFKAQERKLLDSDTITQNIKGITNVIKSILGDDTPIVNNYSWTKDLSILDFLRTYGKLFTVNNMINKDSVRSRIERPDQGISFTEFTYPILQGMDFEHLYENYDCCIQIGGSDQWGNMIAGTDVIHKLHGNDVNVGVITLPLLTKDDGTKFGKSESGTVWLSDDKTTPFELFQFWNNISDSEALRMFEIFQPLEGGMEKFEVRMKNNPVQTKKMFATAMVEVIHGGAAASQVMNISYALFGNGMELDASEIQMLIDGGIAVHQWSNNIIETLVQAGLATSRKMAREFIKNEAIKVNGVPIDETFNTSIKEYVLQRGKKNFVIIRNRSENVTSRTI